MEMDMGIADEGIVCASTTRPTEQNFRKEKQLTCYNSSERMPGIKIQSFYSEVFSESNPTQLTSTYHAMGGNKKHMRQNTFEHNHHTATSLTKHHAEKV
jgi:hypothetical protein